MSAEKLSAASGNCSMSRLAKKPIKIPENVQIEIKNGTLLVKGPKGELTKSFRNDLINIAADENTVVIKPLASGGNVKMLLGTFASHTKNLIQGVIQGFEKKLIIEGVGYKAETRGKDLVLSLGLSHPVIYKAPDDISIKAEKNIITISGIDKEKVGLTASKIRLLKKPEPYKGKGIRYDNEIIKKKAGKRVAGATKKKIKIWHRQ